MKHSLTYSFAVAAVLFSATSNAADWNQWRGPNRDGVAPSSPPLITALPRMGLKPIWTSEEIPAGNDGGWGSPVVSESTAADGSIQQRVYLFAHQRLKLRDLEPRKFPWLPPGKRVGMTDKEYAEYEVKRRNEDEARGKAFKFLETVYCLDAANGKTVWKNEQSSLYTRFPQSGSPTVVDGRIYFLGAGRHVRCLNAGTGKKIWNVRLPGNFRDEFWQSSFVVVEGAAIFLAGHLIGLDTENGKTLWEGDPRKTRGTHASPVVWSDGGQQFVIVNVAGNQTICVEPGTGKELWRITSEANLSTPIVVGNRLITYGNSRKKGMRCFKISRAGAEHVWTFNGAADKGSSPVVVDGFAYVQGDKRLACVDIETGKAAWSTTLDFRRPQYTSLIAADGKVIYALEGMLCFKATSESFEPLIEAKMDETGLLGSEDFFRVKLGLNKLESEPGGLAKAEKLFEQKIGRHGPLPCATPAIADGKLFVRLKKGIVCYDLRDRAVASRTR